MKSKQVNIQVVNIQMEDGSLESNPLRIRAILKSPDPLVWKAKDARGKIWSNQELAGKRVKVEMMTVDVFDDSIENDPDMEFEMEDQYLVPEEEVL